MFSGYPDLSSRQSPWSAELQRIEVCGAPTFVINSELYKLFYNMTTLLLRSLGCKDLRMPAKLEMFIFPALHVLKSKRRLLPRRTPIRQTSRIQQWGPNHGLKGTSSHKEFLGVEMWTEKMGWTRRMMTGRGMSTRRRDGNWMQADVDKGDVCADANGADEKAKGALKTESEGVRTIKRTRWDVG
ncbi:hypothetical protein K443DRAFT_7864 [Laccaria amethystina LaAM-08-1]|uniref:Uncharacterized protein n=1 Tax=Laccaria amethystina LaAM-08-1 TaxID=1095629 RepID=A0A0C9XR74_9AGAR|nr:hypothetical protein K443DRAFT_7864 [Laccaria amethystina LaAM-08-1]